MQQHPSPLVMGPLAVDDATSTPVGGSTAGTPIVHPIHSSQQGLPVQRSPCRYGLSCYRRNPLHFEQFSHPAPVSSSSSSSNTYSSNSSSSSSRVDAIFGLDAVEMPPPLEPLIDDYREAREEDARPRQAQASAEQQQQQRVKLEEVDGSDPPHEFPAASQQQSPAGGGSTNASVHFSDEDLEFLFPAVGSVDSGRPPARCLCGSVSGVVGPRHFTDAELEERRLKLNPEQQRVCGQVLAGRSVFFSGAAGTGKSFCIDYIAAKLQRMGKKVWVCGTSGTAARNVGGITLHKWAGVGLAQEPPARHFHAIWQNREETMKEVFERWAETDVLIIDECSMLSGQFLDKLSDIGKRLRRDLRLGRNDSNHHVGLEPLPKEPPFGGIQMVFVGDFHQLPPVWNLPVDKQQQLYLIDEERKAGRRFPPNSLFEVDRALFCFESDTWKSLITPDAITYLTTVYRQRDEQFLRLLGAVRTGCENGPRERKLVESELGRLRKPLLEREGEIADKLRDLELEPTILKPTNKEAHAENDRRLDLLDGPEYEYRSIDMFEQHCCLSRPECESAFQGEKVLNLRIGAQVMCLMNVDVPGGIVNGTFGVVTGFASARDSCIGYYHDDRKSKFFNPPHNGTEECELPVPVVRFDTGASYVMCPVERDIEMKGEKQASRMQIPLKLAWAISIHKSQGLTLDYVSTNLTFCFAAGQGYVALSRCRTLEGLQVDSFNGKTFLCNPLVRKWHREHVLREGPEGRNSARSSDKSRAPSRKISVTSLGGRRKSAGLQRGREEQRASDDWCDFHSSGSRSRSRSSSRERDPVEFWS